jgi:AraC family transcriptional regulator
MKPARLLVALALAAGALGALAACRSSVAAHDAGAPGAAFVPDLPVTRPPYREVHSDWKERLEQPYVYFEHRGSYTETGRLLPELASALKRAGIAASGPPFALFYDDPGAVPVAELRSRACFPVDRPVASSGRLQAEVLPARTVVYAVVAGPYPELARAYPGLYDHMRRMNWVEDGPLREIYLTPPESVSSWDELLAEVQIPVAQAPR